MTNIEVEYDNAEAAKTAETAEAAAAVRGTRASNEVEVAVQETVQEPNWSGLKVKNLTKDMRAKLLQDYEAGTENPYFKVQQLKNGTTRIVKRTNPLNDSERAEKEISNKFAGKRLTNEQLLLEHVLDLEKRYEIMRLKHKKLKRRYNKLENDLFDSESEEEVKAVDSISRPLDVREEIVVQEPQVQEPQVQEPQVQESIITATFRKPGKAAWRNMISRM